MTLGVLIEALLGGPSTSTSTSQSTTTSDKKGGAREWIKNKLKALSQLLGKLANKALASLPGIIGSIISWILNRAKEVIGWLSQNLWALITVSGQNPPGQNPPGQNPPDKIPLDKIPPRTKSPQDKIPLDKIPPVYFIFY